MHFLHVNGVKKPVPFYNLDVIISVGYGRGGGFELSVTNRNGADLRTAFDVSQLDPKRFMRVNRQFIVSAAAVT